MGSQKTPTNGQSEDANEWAAMDEVRTRESHYMWRGDIEFTKEAEAASAPAIRQVG